MPLLVRASQSQINAGGLDYTKEAVCLINGGLVLTYPLHVAGSWPQGSFEPTGWGERVKGVWPLLRFAWSTVDDCQGKECGARGRAKYEQPLL